LLTPSRTSISRTLVITREQRPWCDPNQNVTYVIRESRPEPPRSRLFKTSKSKSFLHQEQPGRVPAQWSRTILSLAPVRGLTRPSIPPLFHWCEEKFPETSSERPWMFFFSTKKVSDSGSV
jgi:hypothetical protein